MEGVGEPKRILLGETKMWRVAELKDGRPQLFPRSCLKPLGHFICSRVSDRVTSVTQRASLTKAGG